MFQLWLLACRQQTQPPERTEPQIAARVDAEPNLTPEELDALIAWLGPDYLRKLLDASSDLTTPRPPPNTSFDPTTQLYVPTSPRFVPLSQDFITWGENRFYVRDRIDPYTLEPTEDIGPLLFMPWQKTIFRYMLDPNRPLDEWFQLMVISTVKKAGKTGIAGAIGRYTAELFGTYAETICCGSDKEQASDRIYEAILKSIELGPTYDARLQTSYAQMVHPDEDPRNPYPEMVPDYTKPEWIIRQDGARYIPTRGNVHPIAKDYKGQAGGQQTATVYTEMWSMDDERARRLFDETTPPPTRPRAFRLCEGYAGWEGESGLWEEIWEWAMDPEKGARMVTRAELERYGGWPFPPDPSASRYNAYSAWRNHPDPIPLFVNPNYRLCAYIDQGEAARRMPWLTKAYYDGQSSDMSFNRHHLNLPEAHTQEFIPKHWRDNCQIANCSELAKFLHAPIHAIPRALRPFFKTDPITKRRTIVIPPLDANTTTVISVDASVSDDTTARVTCSLAPWDEDEDNPTVLLRDYYVWEPSKQNPMNYDEDLKPDLIQQWESTNCLEIVYDAFQMVDLMTRLRIGEGYWVKSFSQSSGRDQADRDLFNRIRDRKIFWDPTHPYFHHLEKHFAGAARRVPKGEAAQVGPTANRLHIVKKSTRVKIDLLAALSQCVFELVRLTR